MSSSEFFTDIFEEEARCVGKALLAVTAVGYLASQADGSTLFGRDDVQYAIDAYLPQGYDRGIMASRANQRLAKNLIVKRLQINTVKEQVRVAAGREAKLSGLFELFTLSLAGILSAAHVHSLIITLHVIKNMTLVLVYVLRKREAKQGSRGGTVVSTLRSWWSGGTQNFIMKAFVEKLQQHLEKSPFAQNMDEDTMGVGDGPRCLSVEAILKLTIPRCVDAAIQAVKTALNRRAPHVFSVTGIVTGRDVRELLDELSQDFESHLMWLDWLTPKPSSPSSSALLFSTQEQLLSLETSNGGIQHKENAVSSDSDADDDVFNFPAGSTAVLPDSFSASKRMQRDRAFLETVFGPSSEEGPEARAAREEELRCEQLARDQSAGFFFELIHSDSFSAMCVAHAAEVLEEIKKLAADLRRVGSYDVATDSAKTVHVITSFEHYRLQLLDRDFNVPPYLRLFCEETVRATCGKP
ncbi:hypothetical protein TcG_03199 [Trypanosoma cruzi]|nr:hypothetical protein TcG_03199 [Trypanosoma cruzi]